MDLVRQSFGITLAFLLLWLALWWLKKKGFAQIGMRFQNTGAERELQLIDRLVLTPQHSLQLVRIRDRIVVIGVSPAGLTVLPGDATTASPAAARGTAS